MNTSRGKKIKLYIMSDDFKQLKLGELSNWTGLAIIGERKHVPILKKSDSANGTGVYFLIAKDDKSSIKTVYIGETDDIRTRMNDHIRDKNWWTSFVIFVSKDMNLTKAHVKYLERNIYDIVEGNITTIELENKQTPEGARLPQSDVDEMDDFRDSLIYVLKHLGILDFTHTTISPKTPTASGMSSGSTSSTSPKFVMTITNNKHKGFAYLQIINDVYVLQKGSCIRSDDPKENYIRPHNYHKLRKILDEKNLYDKESKEGFYILKEDVEFTSPSGAGAVVRNSSVNGRKAWKTENGITIEAYEQSE